MTERHIHPTRRAALGLIGAAVALPRLAGAAAGAISGIAFGTTWQISGAAPADLEGLRPKIDALFAAIDAQMSPWRADSGLSRFNAMGAGDMAVDPETLHVTRAALALAQASGGAFDPTVGPLVARWGFGPIAGGATPDWRGLRVGNGAIGKTRDDLTLDLCGIAKGRALDLAVTLVRDAGGDNLLFDLGGELRALGQHPSGRDWRVAVQHPLPDQPPAATLRLAQGQAVATSGLRTQSYVLDGRTYGHIIDPGAQAPADGGLMSVTVLADDAMTADGWATALFAAGAGGGIDLARRNSVAALFLVRDGTVIAQRATGRIADQLL
ncbi:FAD:protein FMN transferase [Octadecabacter sp. SW4]|uniref:FAD:protein FMN transferase n=1 Tax=Octadecabacter sp. SW4 TaxID=2602067 RepID=UPI0011C1E70B|nr:FAD:protein FMN transferase [Octadecabacter sp. SW4]QEE36077.1 FAD:protein FMN transferase [Octadecabacter sp. SW4]